LLLAWQSVTVEAGHQPACHHFFDGAALRLHQGCWNELKSPYPVAEEHRENSPRLPMLAVEGKNGPGQIEYPIHGAIVLHRIEFSRRKLQTLGR
jgi:hypothetical protein